MRLVITGGHHSSALPLIHKIQEKHPEIQLYWMGHRYSLTGDKHDSLEYKEITELGISFYEVNAGKFYKTAGLTNLIKLPLGFIQSLIYLIKIKPNLIMSFGGFLAVPVVVSGKLLGIPNITHEQTTVVGYANKLISFLAEKVLISWKVSEKYFSKSKTLLTGLPLRESIFVSRSNSFTADNNLPFVYITAGKNGSVTINTAVNNSLLELLSIANVILQCGNFSQFDSYSELSQTYDQIKNSVPGKLFLRKFVLEDEVGEAFFKADLVVARSGAHTTAEILALNKPALLIPIPWVSHDEQNKNALLVKSVGLAEIMPESDLNPASLLEKIKYMLHNRDLYQNHSPLNFREISANATDMILSEILKYETR